MLVHDPTKRVTTFCFNTLKSVIINQFVPPTFCLCFAFTGVNFRGMLHYVCDVWPMTKTSVDQSELVNVGPQTD